MESIINGTVERVSRTGIMIDGAWYGIFKGASAVKSGDVVSFNWEKSACGRYNNIKGGIKGASGGSVSGPAVSRPSSRPAGSNYSSLGVELGHASNLAMEVMAMRVREGAYEADSPNDYLHSDDFYRDFITTTDKIFKVMKKLRAEYEKPEATAVVAKRPATKKPTIAPPEVDEDDEEDISLF